ncbi:glutathione S-transferase [Rubricella aquisinus]|uniref:Glutathione S-transferase n=1 Tax=Rubricella aquisinus TaxID=2028108 RepID=A0A840WKP2_9RHOB|nr:glutathione S-transferase [Rubricella aquisinus]MBB5515629.1 glutathione S-transferase [Rubricella aquisinus]
MTSHPVLWSFRRCPYAMRARLAIARAGQRVELREILLRDKPQAFLETSPSGTVPCLRLPDRVLDESLDIMIWALERNDPDGLRDMPDAGWAWIAECDGPFKAALDRTKYASRYPAHDPDEEREKAAVFLRKLDAQLGHHGALFGARLTLADLAILPFVRQFAHIDRAWFRAQDWPHLIVWLDRFLESADFARIMSKYPLWSDTAPPIWFDGQA